jgi:hypothetical protein
MIAICAARWKVWSAVRQALRSEGVDRESEVVDVELPNGVHVGVEVSDRRGVSDVGVLAHLDFGQVQGIIDGLAQVVAQSLRRARPQRATAELGLSLKVEAGKLTGVLVKAGGDASIKISLTWERSADSADVTAAGGSSEPKDSGTK